MATCAATGTPEKLWARGVVANEMRRYRILLGMLVLRKKPLLLLTLLLLAGCADLSPSPDMETSILAVSSSDELWWISLISRPDIRVGSIRTPAGERIQQVWDLAWDGQSAYAWAIAFTGSQLYKVRLSDGLANYVGLTGTSLNALASSGSGRLIGIGGLYGRQLYELDPVSGRAIAFGGIELPCASSGDLVFLVNRLLASLDCGLSDVLVEIDLDARRVQEIGPIGFSQVYGLSEKKGILYGATARGELIEINSATGQGRFLRHLPFGVFGTQGVR